MNKTIKIAIIGLGQVGIYLYNELRIKKNEILNLEVDMLARYAHFSNLRS